MAQSESPSTPATKPILTINMRCLKIHAAPFKPSNLSIPPSPFSPRVPVTSPFATSKFDSVFSSLPATASSEPPPPSPLQWLWQCHQCHRTYPIGVTRRCLDDGHFFCAGTTTVKSWRKAKNPRRVKRHRACASEFDYQGWKSWGKWRRNEQDDIVVGESFNKPGNKSSSSSSSEDETEKKARFKDCWNSCDYPSECRWGKQFRPQMPAMTDAPSIPLYLPPPPLPPPPATIFEGILQAQEAGEGSSRKGAKSDFWGALVVSATGRKSARSMPSSPLALSPVTLKDMKAKRSRISKATEPKTPELALQMPTVAAIAEFDFRLKGESSVPLEKVKRKDSGYFSQNRDGAAKKSL